MSGGQSALGRLVHQPRCGVSGSGGITAGAQPRPAASQKIVPPLIAGSCRPSALRSRPTYYRTGARFSAASR